MNAKSWRAEPQWARRGEDVDALVEPTTEFDAGAQFDASASGLSVVGEGIGGLGNDSGFENTDAAFDSDDVFRIMVGFVYSPFD